VKKDQKQKSSKKQLRQQQFAYKKRKRRLLIGVPIIVGIIALVAFVFIRQQPVEGTEDHGAQERGHDSGVEFADAGIPPVGGVHDPRWQNCGIYAEPIDVGPAVHSMEHGAVWVTYRPDLPADEVATLQDLVRGQSYTLLSPYSELKSDVVATAWGVQLEPDSISDVRIEEFIDRYRGGGPEPGAPCTGGLGTPIQ
jgi:hypothetical protein